jgi:sugar lactone lactonase YvrE
MQSPTNPTPWLCAALLVSFFVSNSRNIYAAPLQPGDIVFADAVDKAIIRFNPGSGEREKLASLDLSGSGGGIALDKRGNVYAMINALGFSPYTKFFRLEQLTDELTLISSDRLITSAGRMTVTPDGSSLVVAGQSNAEGWALFRVDLADGRQSVFTKDLKSTFMGIVPAEEHPASVAFGPDGSISMADGAYSHIVQFNGDGTGRRQIVELPFPWLPTEVAVDASGIIYVTALNINPNGVVRVNPSDGTYRILTQGSELSAPVGIAVAPDGSLIVGDAVTDKLVRVDTNTGAQTVLLANVPSPRSIWVFSGGGQTEAPRLNLRQSLGTVAVSWSDVADVWQLQSAPDLNTPLTWIDVASVPVANGANREVVVDRTGSREFFRLRQR